LPASFTLGYADGAAKEIVIKSDFADLIHLCQLALIVSNEYLTVCIPVRFDTGGKQAAKEVAFGGRNDNIIACRSW
jgi:hypothetical protein